MDDQSFDKIVRSQLQNYNDPGDDHDFGPLKSRLTIPRSNPNPKAFVYGSIATVLLLTGVNLFITLYYPGIEYVEVKNVKVDSLISVINELKERSLQTKDNFIEKPIVSKTVPIHNKDNKEPFVQSTPDEPSLSSRIGYNHTGNLNSLLVPIKTPTPRFVFIKTQEPAKKPWKQPEISAKIKNKLEQHYFNGIGIRLAPQVSAGGMTFDNKMSPAAGAGLGADWILSPHLSIETNIRYSLASRSIAKDNSLYEAFTDKYYGTPIDVRQSDNFLSGAVLFGYRQWLTHRDQLSLKVGVTNYQRVLEKYNIKYSQGRYSDPDDRGSISQVHKIDGICSFANTFSVNAGLSRQISRNQVIEVSAFYEQGFGNRDLQLFGFRSSLWFVVK